MNNQTALTARYIDLLKKSLLNDLYIENEAKLIYTINAIATGSQVELSGIFNIHKDINLIQLLRNIKDTGDSIIFPTNITGVELRNLAELSHTMIGRKRLENIQYCVERVISDNVPGDFIETGVWRGGATIFMRGILAAYDINDRRVFVADSFEGVPPPSHKEDEGFDLSASVYPILAVSMDEVRDLFSRYGLLDDNVVFIKGWFKDTLPKAPIERLSILRLDGDLYESTMDTLNPLYDKVVQGGFIIVDDYESCQPCKNAINEFRRSRGITEELLKIDAQSVCWRKG